MPVRLFATALVVVGSMTAAAGQVVPSLSSRPGASYTLYLNFGGFNYTGTWGGTGKSPGNVPAYDTDGNPGSFTATELANIKDIWSRTAEKYAAFNVNVTTVDPAGAMSDFNRQNYYESTPRVMHTIVGGSNAWYGGAGGVSYLDYWRRAGTPSGNGGAGAGYKTNWAFEDNLGAGFPKYVAEAAAHEVGHAAGLTHQGLWSSPTTKVNDYDDGRTSGAGQFSSYRIAPTMGVGYYTDRSTWRVGATGGNSSVTAQNDVRIIQAQPGIKYANSTGFYDDGIGRSTATATALATTGVTINPAQAAGVITPLSSDSPNPIGADNYTKGFFTFTVGAGQTADLNVYLVSGRYTIATDSFTPDPGAVLDARLRLLDGSGNELQNRDTGVFVENIVADDLTAGTYYLEVSSHGGYTDPYGNTYFDMGSYFLAGTFAPVPEPATVLAVAVGAFGLGGLVRRCRRGGINPPAVVA